MTRSRRVRGAGSCPTVRVRIVFRAGVQIVKAVGTTPDNHLVAGPNCCMQASSNRRIGDGSGQPTIRARGVFPAGILSGIATPDDHFAAGPYSRVRFAR